MLPLRNEPIPVSDFITKLDFLFDNRHQTTCKNIATITSDFSKDKYSLQICEGGKATSSKLQVDQENLLILILEARHVGQGRKQFGFPSYEGSSEAAEFES